MICKIQHRGTCLQFEQIALWGEYEDSVFLGLLHTFVSPMGSQTMFGYVIHTFGAYLYFHPLLFGTEYSDVEGFVSVVLGYGKPVAHSLGIGLIHVRYDREYLPAVLLLFMAGRVQNYAYGEEIIYTVHTHMLLFHLLPDAVYALCSALHMELQARLCQFLVYRVYEACHILVSGLFCLVQFLFDVVVCIMFSVF